MTIKHDKFLPAHPLKIHETRPRPVQARAVPDCQMICGTRDELDASLSGEEDVQLCAACC
jgi:hypothetical protein